jgi:YVTN family beta-propeller protein
MAPAAHANAAGLAFVINSGDASVSLIDVDTHREVRRIPVLREPHHMALTPDGKSLLVGTRPATDFSSSLSKMPDSVSLSH